MVNEKLIERGKVYEARQHQRVGIPAAEIRELIRGHNMDNANLQRNPETFHKFVADATLKQYALSCLPNDLAKAHDRGDIHIHDLEYFPARPINCLQSDLRWIIREGLKVDGTGEHTSVSSPARRIETLINHAGQALMAAQMNMSGGQSFSLFNTFLAPFVSNLDYERIKQAMQMFIFNMNQSYASRGGQVIFSSINLDFGIPKFLENEPAYGPDGLKVGTYGDYEEEARNILRAYTDIMLEGDAMGKPFLFPNTIYNLRKEHMGKDYEEDLLKVHELSAKFSVPYFSNQTVSWNGDTSNKMGCRTLLSTNWTGDWDTDTLRTGNLAYISLNLPRIAYKTKIGNNSFYDELDKILGFTEELLLIRRQHALKCLNKFALLPFLTQKNKLGEQYYRIQNATLSFGIVGMNETLIALGIPEGITSKEGQKVAIEILEYINNYAKDLVEETGYRWTVLQSPAETTCGRFANLDKKYYPDYVVSNNSEDSYYTNSTHIPVDESKLLITEKIKIESKFHPLTKGGHIFHGFLGETYPDPEALMSLTKKMAKTELGFWAYTSAFSYCFDCNQFLRGMQEQCNRCGSVDNIEHYSRITGYLQQVGNKKDSIGGWNKEKRQELKDRYCYNF